MIRSTLSPSTIDDLDAQGNKKLHLPARFYGSSRAFCPVITVGPTFLGVKYLSEFPEHLKRYVKNVDVGCFCKMLPTDFDIFKEKQSSVSAKAASFINSFPQLDRLRIRTPHVKFQGKIVTQVKELWCYVYNDVLNNFSAEYLEKLYLGLFYGSSTDPAPQYYPKSVEFSQKLGEYKLPKLHTLLLDCYEPPTFWEIDFQYFKNMPLLAICSFST